MIGILSVFAQLEKDQIAERFTMGRIGRSKAGYYHGGPTAPRGYRYIGGELIVDEFKASQVKEIFRLFLDGKSINGIARQMEQKYGGRWNAAGVRVNFCSTAYMWGRSNLQGQSTTAGIGRSLQKRIFRRRKSCFFRRSGTPGKILRRRTLSGQIPCCPD